jgi:hypothetical protein
MSGRIASRGAETIHLGSCAADADPYARMTHWHGGLAELRSS